MFIVYNAIIMRLHAIFDFFLLNVSFVIDNKRDDAL